MIFRRIKAHVAKENWFAVFIDFFIVVFGVFMGLQVSNWNAARATQQTERAYLVELRAEIVSNNSIIEENLDLMKITIESGERSLAFLEADQPCTQDC